MIIIIVKIINGSLRTWCGSGAIGPGVTWRGRGAGRGFRGVGAS